MLEFWSETHFVVQAVLVLMSPILMAMAIMVAAGVITALVLAWLGIIDGCKWVWDELFWPRHR